MALFTYQGVDGKGKSVKGVIEADNLRAARTKLKSSRIYPTRVTEKTVADKAAQNSLLSGLVKQVKMADIVNMTRQLSVLISAHVPLVTALGAMVDQVENPKLKNILSHVKQQVNEGKGLADAFAEHPDVFSDIYINLVRAGEASGSLDKVMKRLADFTQDQFALVNKVKSAMTYPLAMAVIGGLALILIFSFVVPKITKVLVDQNIPLPIYTEILIGTSAFLKQYWWAVILGGIGAFLLFRMWLKTEKGRFKFDRFLLNAPVLGDLNRKVAISRFAKTLATLLSGGVKILQAINISKFVVGNKVYEAILADASSRIEEGEDIAGPLKKSGYFPPIVTQMISIGEKTGELESMLESVADGYDEEVSNALEAMTSLLEPIMIVVMGGIIGFVVISILVPMMEMTKVN